ncbi:hypothetical protein SCAR479_00562 [Seiridium cardinale]|uniref:Uncharacterized protein n=1 Tax=Seiridium cardinale TaxID=138064 RepID=A0ABR2Y9V5_9PEZI
MDEPWQVIYALFGMAFLLQKSNAKYVYMLACPYPSRFLTFLAVSEPLRPHRLSFCNRAFRSFQDALLFHCLSGNDRLLRLRLRGGYPAAKPAAVALRRSDSCSGGESVDEDTIYTGLCQVEDLAEALTIGVLTNGTTIADLANQITTTLQDLKVTFADNGHLTSALDVATNIVAETQGIATSFLASNGNLTVLLGSVDVISNILGELGSVV